MPSDRETLTTLANDLRRLGLNRTADELNDIIAQAARKRWSATVLLEHIVAAELEEKQRRSVESRLKRARLGRFKPLADWDWGWPTGLDRPALERILTLDFLDRSENLILVGAHGLGKTMLAKNIAHQAVLAGHTALFTHRCRPAARPQRAGDRTRPRTPAAPLHAARAIGRRRARVPLLRRPRRRPDLPTRQPTLRAPLDADHYQPAVQTLGYRLSQRLLRCRPDRPTHAPR